MALRVSEQPFELREVLLRDKPEQLKIASAKATVPVLVLPDDQVIDESLAIMKWALERSDPQAWLTPTNGTLADMRALITQCDGSFKSALDRYKYPSRFAQAEPFAHRTAGAAFLSQLNQRLQHLPQLFGSRAALADIAIAPFVRQFAMTDQRWFDEQPWPDLRTWLGSFLNSPLFTTIMIKHPRWEPPSATP